jgi:hypothetical protein
MEFSSTGDEPPWGRGDLGDDGPRDDGPRDDVPWDDVAWGEGVVPPVPDDVDLVTEVAGMMAVFAAQRFVRVDVLRRNALADAARYCGGVAEIVERSVRLEVAAALRISEHTAGTLLATAEALVHRYPAALEALGRAAITEQHAQILVTLLDAASPAVRERLAGRAVTLAQQTPTGAFRRGLRRLIDREESTTLTERHEAALADRRVVIEPAHDGLAWLHALIPAVEAHAIHNRLTAIGKAIKAHSHASQPHPEETHPEESRTLDQLRADQTRQEETRTLDQLRADALGDLLIDGDISPIVPEARGIRATVALTVPAVALLENPDQNQNQNQDQDQGEDEAWTSANESPEHSRHAGPATVEGLGPIPLDIARELCGGADGWMRVLTHPETGVVLSVGRTQYRPPAQLRRLVRWRAGRCMAPGCGIPAARCEIDHTIAWEHGGHTCACNLAPLCKGHHTIKHHGGWTVQQIEGSGGSLRWTSPTGRQYTVHPERRTPVFRPSRDSAPAPF